MRKYKVSGKAMDLSPIEILKSKLKLERPGGVSEVMGLGSPPLSVFDL